MKRLLAFVLSLAVAAGGVAIAHRLSLRCPQPSLYARLALNADTRDLSLVLTNIGTRKILIPVGRFDIFVRPSPRDKGAATLYMRLGFAGREGKPDEISTLELNPGEATSIGGLYRFAGRLPKERDTLYSVFEVAEETGEKLGAWHGIVRSFPVKMSTEKR